MRHKTAAKAPKGRFRRSESPLVREPPARRGVPADKSRIKHLQMTNFCRATLAFNLISAYPRSIPRRFAAEGTERPANWVRQLAIREPPARVPYESNIPRMFDSTLLRFLTQRGFAPCGARRGRCPSTPPPFEKGGRKLFPFVHQASAA